MERTPVRSGRFDFRRGDESSSAKRVKVKREAFDRKMEETEIISVVLKVKKINIHIFFNDLCYK